MQALVTRIALVAAASLALAAGAQAAQKTTSKCSVTGPGGNTVTQTFGAAATRLNDIAVTVNNNSGANKNAYIHFSADAGVPEGSEMRVSFSLDGANGVYAGPQNLGSHAEFWQTRSTIAVLSIPPGRHTIAPEFWVQGVTGSIGIIDDRCMIVTF